MDTKEKSAAALAKVIMAIVYGWAFGAIVGWDLHPGNWPPPVRFFAASVALVYIWVKDFIE